MGCAFFLYPGTLEEITVSCAAIVVLDGLKSMVQEEKNR
jgi:hypothetical protein